MKYIAIIALSLSAIIPQSNSFLTTLPFPRYRIHLQAQDSNIESSYAETLPGISQPLGFWDPLKITRNSDVSLINYLREAELHHSRIAMVAMAVLPIIDYYDSVDLAIDAYDMHPKAILSGVGLMTITLYEICRIAVAYESPDEKLFRLKQYVVPGKLYNSSIPLEQNQLSYDYQTKELNNGRLAMVGSLIYIVQEFTTNSKVF